MISPICLGYETAGDDQAEGASIQEHNASREELNGGSISKKDYWCVQVGRLLFDLRFRTIAALFPSPPYDQPFLPQLPVS